MAVKIIIVVALLAWGAAFADAEESSVQIEGPIADAAKSIQIFKVTSPYLGKTSMVQVLSPDKIEPGQKLRTLYVLPVAGNLDGGYGDAIAEVRKSDAPNKYGLICVTMSFDSVPWFGSHATDPHKRHDQYIKQVVVPLIESHYPVTGKSADRLLIGYSKSGWGAVSLLLRDPDFFGAACSWDAPLMMTQANLKWGSRDHFGTPEQAAPYVPSTLV